MQPTLLAIFIASLLGSVHCAGMCGAFAAIATNPVTPKTTPVPTQITINRRRPLRATLLHTTYHVGRLMTYVTLGIAAGAAGSALDAGGALLGVQRIAAILAGITLVTIGVLLLIRRLGVLKVAARTHSTLAPSPFSPTQLLVKVQSSLQRKPDATRALFTGITTVLLPCGWLYTFVIIAAGTGTWWQGGVAMAAFWLGTIPALSAFGLIMSLLSAPLQRRMPIVSAVFFLICGVLTIFGRMAMPTSEAHNAHIIQANGERTNLLSISPTCNAPASNQRSVINAD